MIRNAPTMKNATSSSAVTDNGMTVGTDVATRTRVVSKQAARGTAKMMEKVVDPEDGVAPAAQVPGYLVAGKTGTAQRVDPECGCYDGSTSVSFGGFAPADDARFTVYVVIHAPRGDAGGGSTAGAPSWAPTWTSATRAAGGTSSPPATATSTSRASSGR